MTRQELEKILEGMKAMNATQEAIQFIKNKIYAVTEGPWIRREERIAKRREAGKKAYRVRLVNQLLNRKVA